MQSVLPQGCVPIPDCFSTLGPLGEVSRSRVELQFLLLGSIPSQGLYSLSEYQGWAEEPDSVTMITKLK